MDKKLYKSSSNFLIAGVCGGISEYFNIDANIIRLIFVVFGLFGAGVLVYILLWIIVPNSPSIDEKENVSSDRKIFEMDNENNTFELKNNFKNNRSFAFILIVIGVLFLLNNFFHIFAIFRYFDFSKIWPIILIVLGVVLIIRNKNKN